MTRSAGRPATESRGGGTGGRASRGGGRVREHRRRNVETTGEPEGQVNDQGGGTNGGVGANRGADGVLDFSIIISQQLNVIMNNDRRGCTYKEFLACNHKEYDSKGGVIVFTRWIEKMESVQDMSGYEDNQKVKYIADLFNHAMVGASHAAYTDRFHELARLVPHFVTQENKKIERYAYGLALYIRGMVAAT
ncbi:hypothetical protein Tco_1258523 [Tanacetum coccineum]